MNAQIAHEVGTGGQRRRRPGGTHLALRNTVSYRFQGRAQSGLGNLGRPTQQSLLSRALHQSLLGYQALVGHQVQIGDFVQHLAEEGQWQDVLPDQTYLPRA